MGQNGIFGSYWAILGKIGYVWGPIPYEISRCVVCRWFRVRSTFTFGDTEIILPKKNIFEFFLTSLLFWSKIIFSKKSRFLKKKVVEGRVWGSQNCFNRDAELVHNTKYVHPEGRWSHLHGVWIFFSRPLKKILTLFRSEIRIFLKLAMLVWYIKRLTKVEGIWEKSNFLTLLGPKNIFRAEKAFFPDYEGFRL